ncbi:hypothetical protein Tco_0034435 [Tanacetum coccineum]
MAALKFASSHNMVAFLDKPTESDGFEQIVDFLNVHPIKYTLTVNLTIYTACIEQFWATTKVKTVNGEVQIQALVDKKKVIITETSVRSDLNLEDVKDKTKTQQAVEITELKKRVNKLEGKRKSKPPGMKRLFKIGRSTQVVSSKDEGTTLVDETHGRNDEEMFDIGILDGEEVFAKQDVVKKEVSTTEVATDSTTATAVDELTLAQTLIEIKAAKPKAVT